MSKATLFVVAYSFVLIGLFSTFFYLMTTVNPEPMKQDKARRYGSDDYLYPNDVLLPKDNVAFGLEKVTDDYDTIDVEQRVQPITPSTVYKLRPEIPSTTKQTKNSETIVTFNKRQQSYYTRKLSTDAIKIVNKSIEVPLRGFKRSINQNNEHFINFSTPPLLVMEIKHVYGKLPYSRSRLINAFEFYNENNTVNNEC